MSRPVPILVLVAMLGLGPAVAQGIGAARTDQGTPRAWELLQASQRALDEIGSAAQGSPGLRSVRAAPFWDTLEEMDRALAQVRRTLPVRGERYFQALRDGSRALAQLRTVWPRLGVQAPGVDQGLRQLGVSYRQLRTRHGAEQLRRERGGALTPQEREHFRHLQRAQTRLVAVLLPLRFQAAKRGDRATLAQVDRLLDRADEIASAEPTLDEYLEASLADDEIQGEWAGSARYAEADYGRAWHQADAVVEELFAEAEAGFVFTVDASGMQTILESAERAEASASALAPEGLPDVVIYEPEGDPSDDADRDEAGPAAELYVDAGAAAAPEALAGDAAEDEAAAGEPTEEEVAAEDVEVGMEEGNEAGEIEGREVESAEPGEEALDVSEPQPLDPAEETEEPILEEDLPLDEPEGSAAAAAGQGSASPARPEAGGKAAKQPPFPL